MFKAMKGTAALRLNIRILQDTNENEPKTNEVHLSSIVLRRKLRTSSTTCHYVMLRSDATKSLRCFASTTFRLSMTIFGVY
jgi:hypothetical protein